ncbi:hypothetical protein V493_02981 [Pseudogymnoascus sp. VKM F-4281 (FW-2241)]|nr:hypothetical protein V493_02981 [Pseudogymnoascus sp. VKM F-4281 (FW-2241)]
MVALQRCPALQYHGNKRSLRKDYYRCKSTDQRARKSTKQLSLAIYKKSRESALGGVDPTPKPDMVTPATPDTTPRKETAAENLARLQRLVHNAGEEVARDEAAAGKAAAAKKAIESIKAGGEEAAAGKAAQEARDVYNTEQKAAKEGVAALLAVERIACYIQLAKDIEEAETLAAEKALGSRKG